MQNAGIAGGRGNGARIKGSFGVLSSFVVHSLQTKNACGYKVPSVTSSGGTTEKSTQDGWWGIQAANG